MAPNGSIDDLPKRLARFDAASCETEEARAELLAAARTLCQRLEKPMETLLRIAWIDTSHTACLKIGIDVGLFEALGEVGKGATYSVEELAKTTSVEKELLERILRVLASNGTIAQAEDDGFTATALSHALTRKECSSAIDFRYAFYNPIFHQLPAFLARTHYRNPRDPLHTALQPALATPLSAFDWLAAHPAVFATFNHHMAGYTSQRRTWDAVYPIRERLLPDYDALAAGETGEDTILVDLGGGAGHDLARFAATALPPTLTRPCLVLQDLPAVLASAPPLPPTITTTPIDFFLSAPVPGARAYYLHSILHDWPDDRARAILRTMRPALLHRTPSGRKPKLLLHENVLRGEGGQTQPAALDMIMLGAFAAWERSEGQWRALLEGAGYRVTGVWGKEGVDEGVVEAEAIEGWDEG